MAIVGIKLNLSIIEKFYFQISMRARTNISCEINASFQGFSFAPRAAERYLLYQWQAHATVQKMRCLPAIWCKQGLDPAYEHMTNKITIV